MYQGDLVKSIKSLKKYLKNMKPTDDYVRGYKDAQIMIQQTLDDVLDVIKPIFYCQDCEEVPAEHYVPHNFVGEQWTEQYCEDCMNNQPDWVLKWYNRRHMTTFKRKDPYDELECDSYNNLTYEEEE